MNRSSLDSEKSLQMGDSGAQNEIERWLYSIQKNAISRENS